MFQTHNRKLSAQGTPSPYAHHLFWYLQKWSAKANSGACPTRLPSFCQSDQEHLTQGSDLSWQTMGNSKTLKNTVLFLTHVRIYSTYLSLKNHRTSNFMRNKTTGKKWNTEGKYYENTINKYIKKKKNITGFSLDEKSVYNSKNVNNTKQSLTVLWFVFCMFAYEGLSQHYRLNSCKVDLKDSCSLIYLHSFTVAKPMSFKYEE